MMASVTGSPDDKRRPKTRCACSTTACRNNLPTTPNSKLLLDASNVEFAICKTKHMGSNHPSLLHSDNNHVLFTFTIASNTLTSSYSESPVWASKMNDDPVTEDSKLAAGFALTTPSPLITTLTTPWISCCRTTLMSAERFALHPQSTPPQPASHRHEAKQFPTPSLQLAGNLKHEPWPEHCNHGTSRLNPGHSFGRRRHCRAQ
jgi:hypothetical protein